MGTSEGDGRLLIGTHGALTDPGWVRRVFPDGQNAYDSSKVVTQLSAAVKPVLTAGLDPFASIKPPSTVSSVDVWDQDVAAISAHIRTVLQNFPERHYYFTVWHEPEDNMSGTVYTMMFDFWYSHLKAAVANDRFHMGPVANIYRYFPGRSAYSDPDAYTPRNFDFRGADAYSHTTVANGGSLDKHAGFQRWLTTVSDPTTIFLVERGFDVADADQGYLLSSDYAYLKAKKVYGYLYWNTAANGHDWPLGSKATAVLRSMVQAELLHPSAPLLYTQAALDKARADAYAAGEQDAFHAVLDYVNGKLGST